MEVIRPTLLLDETKCQANIRRMADKARRANVSFRPHFKTHQSHAVGRWFREEGVTKSTVSSIRMATYFAADGWNDITVAFPLNFLEIGEINRLAASIRLNLCIVSAASLKKLLEELRNPVHCFIEIDCGYRRTGLEPTDIGGIDEIIKLISSSPLLTLAGLLTHAGQSYSCRSGSEILKVHQQTTQVMRKLGARYRREFPDLVLSIGDTPTCSIATDFSEVGEIRPGNFVFYDIMQRAIGSCSSENIAIAMACPVVALYPARNEIVIHGGGVHFSKDFLRREDDGSANFGEVVHLTATGWELPSLPVYIKSLSQEHGVLHAQASFIEKLNPGDLLGVLPVHSCMTADAMGEYFTMNDVRITMMPKF